MRGLRRMLELAHAVEADVEAGDGPGLALQARAVAQEQRKG